MALTKFTGATDTISGLMDKPNQDGGLTAAQLKSKFDQSAIDTEAYLNNILTEELDGILYTPGGTTAEVIEARKGKASLKLKIDDIDSQLADIAVNVKSFGAIGDGVSDDTIAFQNAINAASLIGADVKCDGERTYITGSLMPKPNVLIDLNGSILKLKDNANLPLFYDYLEPTIRSNFGVINGTLDCNTLNNSDAINQSAGTLWLTNWDNLYFRNIKVINAFRNVFNFYGIRNIVAENIHVKDCGRTNTNGFYSYGFSAEGSAQRRNSNIILKNFICENMYGFGIHVKNTDGFEMTNLQFIDISRLNDGIAITVTDSTNGDLTNISIKKATKPYSVDSHAIEINNSHRIKLDNVNIDSVRTEPILFGDNGTGIVGLLNKISNIKTTNTGGYSLNINYVDGLEIKNCQFDKEFTTGYSNPTKNVSFINCKFAVSCSALMVYRRFGYKNTIFSDLIILEKINEVSKVAYSFSMATSESKDISLAIPSVEQCFIGEVDIITKLSSGYQQGSYAKYLLYAYGSSIQTSALDAKIIGSYEKTPTITFSGNTLNLVNNTGASIIVNVIFSNKSITSLSFS